MFDRKHPTDIEDISSEKEGIGDATLLDDTAYTAAQTERKITKVNSSAKYHSYIDTRNVHVCVSHSLHSICIMQANVCTFACM